MSSTRNAIDAAAVTAAAALTANGNAEAAAAVTAAAAYQGNDEVVIRNMIAATGVTVNYQGSDDNLLALFLTAVADLAPSLVYALDATVEELGTLGPTAALLPVDPDGVTFSLVLADMARISFGLPTGFEAANSLRLDTTVAGSIWIDLDALPPATAYSGTPPMHAGTDTWAYQVAIGLSTIGGVAISSLSVGYGNIDGHGNLWIDGGAGGTANLSGMPAQLKITLDGAGALSLLIDDVEVGVGVYTPGVALGVVQIFEQSHMITGAGGVVGGVFGTDLPVVAP